MNQSGGGLPTRVPGTMSQTRREITIMARFDQLTRLIRNGARVNRRLHFMQWQGRLSCKYPGVGLDQ
jgi:hypothetical protein